ncbi:MAG TPA: ATP synthase F1 subunit gamma [Bacteroidota bacterium]|jgi:F-type H+-transporting ATPase subunit gamma
MATLREIRRRIGGVKSTQKITKAMKMVAAAKLRRAQDAVIAARPYARKMKELLTHLASEVDLTANPHFAARAVKNVAVVVVTADRGLCGAFNSNLVRAAAQHCREQYGAQAAAGGLKVICVGRKGFEFFAKHDYRVAGKYIGVYAGLQFSTAQEIVSTLVKSFLAGEVDRVDIVSNEFKSIVQHRIVIDQFLPIPAAKIDAPASAGGHAPAPGSPRPAPPRLDYIYEPSGEAIISALVPKHLNFQFWRILLESNAAEQGARMAAMDNATTNASELIRSLQLSYNKARQASITKELLEIVSGAEALKQSL